VDGVRIDGLTETRRALRGLREDVNAIRETEADIERVGVGQGRVHASKLGTVAEFSYPTRNVRPSRFMHAAVPAAEDGAAEAVEAVIQQSIRKRNLQ
jgi:hypothetical protein